MAIPANSTRGWNWFLWIFKNNYPSKRITTILSSCTAFDSDPSSITGRNEIQIETEKKKRREKPMPLQRSVSIVDDLPHSPIQLWCNDPYHTIDCCEHKKPQEMKRDKETKVWLCLQWFLEHPERTHHREKVHSKATLKTVMATEIKQWRKGPKKKNDKIWEGRTFICGYCARQLNILWWRFYLTSPRPPPAPPPIFPWHDQFWDESIEPNY